jgi:hypothetical protein
LEHALVHLVQSRGGKAEHADAAAQTAYDQPEFGIARPESSYLRCHR